MAAAQRLCRTQPAKQDKAVMVAAQCLCRFRPAKKEQAIMAPAIRDIDSRPSGTGAQAGETGRRPARGRQCTGAEATFGHGVCPHGW